MNTRLCACITALMVLAAPVLAQQQANTATDTAPTHTIVSTACEPGAPDGAKPSLDLRTAPGGAMVVWVRALVLEGRGTCGELRAEQSDTGDSRWRVFQAD